jgi:hypothetical protein
LNSEDELCHFKILQIITKEKDEDEYREGEANISNCEKTLRSKKGQQAINNSPFLTTVPRPDPVSSYHGPTAEQQQQHQQIAELQSRLQSALKLVAIEQSAAQQAQIAAMQAKANEEATAQHTRQMYDELEAAKQQAQQTQAVLERANTQHQQLVNIQAELAATKAAAFEQQTTAQQAKATMEQSAAQQQAAAQAAFEQSHAQQQQMAQMQAELAAAKRLSEETKAELAAAKRIAAANQQADMEQAAAQVSQAAIGKMDERALIERLKSKIGKKGPVTTTRIKLGSHL